MKQFLVLILNVLQQYIVRPILIHFATFYYISDPIQTKCSEYFTSATNPKHHFGFAICMLLLNVIYGTVGLTWKANRSSHFTCNNISENPYIFTHQMSPRIIWSPIDFCFSLDILVSLAVFGILILRPNASAKYQISKKNFNLDERKQVNRLLAKIVWVRGCIFSNFPIGTVWFWANVLHNDNYSRSFASALYWIIVFPLFIFYIAYGNNSPSLE